MITNILDKICERVIKEQPEFGKINIKLVFYSGKLKRIDFKKTEINLIKEEHKNVENEKR
jgi:hypothetical protein